MNREFDVIIYGASGFTGRLVAEYMGSTYGRSINWAMAGRNTVKLAEVRDEIGASPETPLVTADADDLDSLRVMVKSAQCICSTVGPYQLYGSELVRLCAEEGTHYVDLSGEPGWMHDMIVRTTRQRVPQAHASCTAADLTRFLLTWACTFFNSTRLRLPGNPCPVFADESGQ